MSQRLAMLAALVFVIGTATASAGPWTPEKKHGQVTLTTSVYRTRSMFEADRKRNPFEFDGSFDKVELNPYVEVGLTNRLSLIGNFFVSNQQFTNQFGSSSNAGVSGGEVAMKYRLSGTDRAVLFAVLGTVRLPVGEQGGEVRLTDGQTDVEGRLAIGGSIGGSSRPPFWNVDSGYRYRSQGMSDEIRVDASIGTYIHPRVMLLGQMASTISLRNQDVVRLETNPTLSPDYDLYRVQGSVTFLIVNTTRVHVGAYSHAFGRNTGAGGGLLTGLSYSF